MNFILSLLIFSVSLNCSFLDSIEVLVHVFKIQLFELSLNVVNAGLTGPYCSQNREVYMLLLPDESVLSLNKSMDVLKVSAIDIFFKIVSMKGFYLSDFP